MKKLIEKYREILVYAIVGGLTTIFCWVFCFFLEKYVFDANDAFQNFLINSIDWLAGVIFAYPLNRMWVFKSKNPKIFKEFMGFSASRLTTYFLDIFIMWLFVNVWPLLGLATKVTGWLGVEATKDNVDRVNFWIAKIFISAILVTIANYIFSKLLIFKKKKDDKETGAKESTKTK